MYLETFAKNHKEQHGFPPLIIGRLYDIDRNEVEGPVRLNSAAEHFLNVTVVTGFDAQFTCDKEELIWKPAKGE